jgi:hypothetical protein
MYVTEKWEQVYKKYLHILVPNIFSHTALQCLIQFKIYEQKNFERPVMKRTSVLVKQSLYCTTIFTVHTL